MTERATAWSVTINNPVSSDEESIATARQKGWTVEGQLEKGAEGTSHYQLMVKTPQVRFSAVKKMFPRAHIEQARNVKALEQYVHKDETREGELKVDSSKYPSLQKLWDMFAEWLDDKGSWWNWDSDIALINFDKFICDKIEAGFVVETMAVNPQIRSCVKNYLTPIIHRSNIRRQTDRQTDEESVSSSI